MKHKTHGYGFWLGLIASLPCFAQAANSYPARQVRIVVPAIVVRGNSPALSAQDFISLAKDKPGALNFGSVGGVSLAHLSGERFRAIAGIRVTQVFYKGAPRVMIADIAKCAKVIRAAGLRAE